MILSILLWLVAWRIRLRLFFLFKKNPSIRDEILAEDFSIQIQTFNKKQLRCFILEQGKFKSFRKELSEPSIRMTFPDEKTAREVFKAVRQDKSQIFTFIQEKKLTMEGDFSVLQKIFLIKEKIDGNGAAA